MKYLSTSAIALILASGAAFAESHNAGDDAAMENEAGTMQTEDTMQSETAMQDGETMDGETMQDDTSMAMNDDGEYTSDELWNERANLIRTRDITGGTIYTINAANDEGWDTDAEWNEVGADWNQIGEIEDIVLSRNGQMTGIVAEVGGFLDIGDKHVVISLDDVNLVAVDDENYAYVTRLSEEQLESMEGVDEGFWN